MLNQSKTFHSTIGSVSIDARGRVRTAHEHNGASLRMRRAWYEGEGEQQGQQGGQSQGNTDTSAGNSGGQQGQGQGGQQGGKTFTQEELEKVLKERLARAEEAAQKKLLEQIGAEKLDDVKALLDDKKKRDEAAKSDLQKAQDALARAEQDKKAAEERAAKAEAERIADRVDARIKELAGKANAVEPKDVVKLIRDEHKDDLAKAISAEGVVDDKAIEKILEDVKKARSHWFNNRGAGSPSNNNGSGSGAVTEQDKKAREANFRRVRRGI